MVPNTEMNGLMLTLEEAISLAVSGYLADGYDCLVAGLRKLSCSKVKAMGGPTSWSGATATAWRPT